MTGDLRPATERLLERLPGKRLLYVTLWALVPWLNAGANLLLDTGARSAIWEQSRTLVVLNYAALSVAIVVALWGAARLARRLELLRATRPDLFAHAPADLFRAIGDRAGPVAAAGATAIALGLAVAGEGAAPAVLRGATWFLVGVPLWTYVWTYASLQLGLVRLGRAHVVSDVHRVEPTLGLRPLGAIAFMALWMLLAALVPIVVTGLPDIVGVAIGLLVLVGAIATFFLSLIGLHRQMADVKADEVRIARELYADAYAPVRTAPTLETLEQQSRLLAAADALEKRALAIHEWPLDEGTIARLITIATSVTAVVVARLILDPFGL